MNSISKWMRSAAAFIASLGISACHSDPQPQNVNDTAHDREQQNTNIHNGDKINSEINTNDLPKAEENIVLYYGPPEWFEGTRAPEQPPAQDTLDQNNQIDNKIDDQEADIITPKDYDPFNQRPVTYYGPPSVLNGKVRTGRQDQNANEKMHAGTADETKETNEKIDNYKNMESDEGMIRTLYGIDPRLYDK